MVYPTESKAQGWRAMARFDDGREALLFIGRSSTQVRHGYVESYSDLLDEEEREQVVSISLQRLARRSGRRQLGASDVSEGAQPGAAGARRGVNGLSGSRAAARTALAAARRFHL